MTRVIGDAGRKIVMDFEQCRLEAYTCPAGKVTIGWGHTGDVKLGMKVTQHQADVILEHDLQKFEQAVSEMAPNTNANQNSALVSLCFNIGIEAFRKSTLLRYVVADRPAAAAAQFAKWVHAGDKVLPGLVKRRAAEAALFLTPVS